MQPALSVAPRRRRGWPRMALLLGVLGLLAAGRSVVAQPGAAAHPLDPLTKAEIVAAVEILRADGRVAPGSLLPTLVLQEPPKEDVLRFQPGGALRRVAFAVVWDRAGGKTFEASVDLGGRRVLSWKERPGVQPALGREDSRLADQIVRADPRWQEAMRKRGLTRLENVQIDPWPAGYFDADDERGVRMVRALSYYRGSAWNPYARPIEGVVAHVDLSAKRVLRFVDTGVVPLPPADDGDVGTNPRTRPALKPLQIVQPQGAGFEVRGNEVRWQNWRFRFAMHPREGVVLYTVGYEDAGKLRAILYRASLSEMVVPYGDPDAAWYFRATFDAGEVGLGRFANSLEPRTDAPANAVFIDATLAGEQGIPEERPRAMALFERDGGVLWKHRDAVTGRNETRRARQLVLSYITTVGNYDYGFNWVFHQDGTLEMEVLLTGIMQAKGVLAGAPAPDGHGGERHAHPVGDRLAAVHHQHFFNFRLDFDVDGAAGNSVMELDAEPVPPGAENPYGNAFTMKETLLRTELQAQRALNLAAGRKWKVTNASVLNALGLPVGYMLLPGENAVPYAAPDSWIRRRAGFMNAHLWVTAYDPTQMHAAGDYPNQSRGDDGLPAWIRANRPLANQDVVVWYTMGITHLPRPEEWPVMPVHRAGFRLVPSGFFARNPALDVPRAP